MDPVAIANLALGWLGAPPIAAFDDSTREAELVGAAFDGLRRAVLEDRDWTFATDRLLLPKSVAAPAFGYAAKYALPTTVLRVISCSVDDGDDLEWIREGAYILTEVEADTLRVRAIVDVEDSTLWTSGFVQALATRIAADLAVPVCQDAVIASKYHQLYFQRLRDAAANDGRQGRSRKITAPSLARRRW
jgi:hypothetical protein